MSERCDHGRADGTMCPWCQQADPAEAERKPDGLLAWLKRTQCCDPLIDSQLGAAIVEITRLEKQVSAVEELLAAGNKFADFIAAALNMGAVETPVAFAIELTDFRCAIARCHAAKGGALAIMLDAMAGIPCAADDMKARESEEPKASPITCFIAEKQGIFMRPSDDQAPSWRVGTQVPLNVYEGNRPVCQCHNSDDAARIVAAMNAKGAK